MPLVFFSAGNVPLALPQTIALGAPGIDGVNARLGKWLLERLADDDPGKDQEKKRIRGWPMMDFCDVRLMRMFVECNFMWRTNKQEGWV
jgi:1-phosphatidylinositol phosphodiesterase